MGFRKLLKIYSHLAVEIFIREVQRFMILHKTRGKIYLICPKKETLLHALEYRIKFLSAVIDLD